MYVSVHENRTDSEKKRDAFGPWWRGGWRGDGDPAELKKRCPFIKGVFVPIFWSKLEPRPEQFNWDYFDSTMTLHAELGYYIQFMAWVGPHSPEWIYQHGVPEVKTTPTVNPWGELRKWTYPYYLNKNYITYYHRMIRKVAEHIDTLPMHVREKIFCLQTAEGTTGDEGGYKGELLDKQYEISKEDWYAFKHDTWKLFDKLYKDKNPKIHLLINSGNKGQYHQWIMDNMPDTWRKAGNPGHGYQLNNEIKMIRFLDPVINVRNRNGEFIRCRSEMDETHKGWFRESPIWNQYWLNLWVLHFGIDFLHNNTVAFDDECHNEGFEFYAKYGGQKDPMHSPGAWCALRDGLDAGDYKRFPEETFGPGRFDPESDGQEEGIKRCLKIAGAFNKFGARQGDPEKAMYVVMKNRDAKAMNDVGWNIWPGNYYKFLEQIDPAGTSQGYWRVGSKEQPYGRFGRGFDIANKKNQMFFKINGQFFHGQPLNAEYPVFVRIVYFDKGFGSWQLLYDGVGNELKTADKVDKTDSGKWKEVSITIEDGYFSHRCPHGSDLVLDNSGQEDTIFHMVELIRKP